MNLVNNEKQFSHIITKDSRLFDYLKDELVVSMRLTNELLKTKNLKVNEKEVKKNINIHKGDEIQIFFEDETHHYEAENINLDILYETADLLIINKPPHILVHPTQNHPNHTLANAISYYYQTIGLKRKIRFVNRLDQDTSGILIIAKNAYSHQFLQKQFDDDTIVKKYLTIVEGKLKKSSGVITESIGRNESHYEISETGKESKTIYKVLKEFESYSLVECELKSGRTHQIRVHLSSIGGYILGDTFYNKATNLINRQALHSYKLTFNEPRTFQKKTIICELPTDMIRLL